MIARPQNRAAVVKSVRVEDGDQIAGTFNFVPNMKTQTRSPLPAYKSPPNTLQNTVMTSGRTKTTAYTGGPR